MTSSLKWAWLSLRTSLTPGGSVDGAACPNASGTVSRITAATSARTGFLWRDIRAFILVIYQYDAAGAILRPMRRTHFPVFTRTRRRPKALSTQEKAQNGGKHCQRPPAGLNMRGLKSHRHGGI